MYYHQLILVPEKILELQVVMDPILKATYV